MSVFSEHAVLYVDDEAMSLKYFELEYSKDFHVLTAGSAADGWELIQKHPGRIGVLLTDQRMPGQSGVQLLEKVRQHFPRIIRILVTAYSDIESAVAAVNTGAIYRYVHKPWDVADLRVTLMRALEFFALLNERDALLREKLSALHRVMTSDRAKNLGLLAAGLNCHFRNSIQAATRFVEAVKPAKPAAAGQISRLVDDATPLEQIGDKIGRELFYVASSLKPLAAGPPFFSSEALALRDLLAPLSAVAGASGAGAVSLKLGTPEPRLKGNAAQLKAVFSRLASCLSTLAPEKALFTIESQEVPAAAGPKMIRVVLSDSGEDWDAEKRARLFAPFSDGPDGKIQPGLDLAICYILIYHHGGRMEVPGQAARRVVLELPVDPLAVDADSNQEAQLARLCHSEWTAE